MTLHVCATACMPGPTTPQLHYGDVTFGQWYHRSHPDNWTYHWRRRLAVEDSYTLAHSRRVYITGLYHRLPFERKWRSSWPALHWPADRLATALNKRYGTGTKEVCMNASDYHDASKTEGHVGGTGGTRGDGEGVTRDWRVCEYCSGIEIPANSLQLWFVVMYQTARNISPYRLNTHIIRSHSRLQQAR